MLTEQGTDKTDKAARWNSQSEERSQSSTQDIPSKHRDSRGNDVGEQRATSDTREPDDVVLLGVPSEIVGTSE